MPATPTRHQFRSLKSPKIDEKTNPEAKPQKKPPKMPPGNFFLRFWLPTWPLGMGVREVTFFRFFELWALLGPKCLQELPQEPPGPPQVSIFIDFGELFWSDVSDS